ncbi:hypothetical protein QQP08_003883 [Theobroma cacao]|nr:hypothetical protein QQP08_003883 [Theobroma cacao]
MDTTRLGRSCLANDFATHFPIEIINANSIQVYQDFDVFTNKCNLLLYLKRKNSLKLSYHKRIQILIF